MIDRLGFEPDEKEILISWMAMGLCGEAGEVADHIKKGVFHQHGIDREKLKEELGDVIWYVAAICQAADLTLAEAMEGNINKLLKRYPDGFSAAASQQRQE